MSDAIELDFEDRGARGAPALVLLHAIGTSAQMWRPQIDAWADRWRLITVDLRGHGASPIPPGPYSMPDLVSDVVSVLGRAEVRRASICGLSLGGMVGLSLAANHPERVDRLVAACVVARPSAPGAWLDRARAVREGGTSSIASLVLERWGYAKRAPEIARLVTSMLETTDPEGYAGCCEAIASMDLTGDLPSIIADTLLLAGSDDPAAPVAVAVDLAERIPSARAEEVEGAAHLANVERPDAFTRAVERHLLR